jgi:tartrate dehydrogenase/decarboxylase / D-malate dehydrogenase
MKPQEAAPEAAESTANLYRIAVIPGDGIGPEVIWQGCEVLEATARRCDLTLVFEELPWGSDYYKRHGRMMPDDAVDLLRTKDAIYFGASGSPGIPDHVTAWQLQLPLRQQLDLFVNLRPARRFPGVPCPAQAWQPEQPFDLVIIRENTEGEYLDIGGRLVRGGSPMLATQTAIFTREGVERILRYGFQLAGDRLLTSVTKSNALAHTLTFWDEIASQVAADYPETRWERMHVDAAAYRLVRDPARFGVLVASNLFGDILSDLTAGLQGSLGLAPSANLHPGRRPGTFEPVHGSAPDIAGRGIANPIGAVWSAALMLQELGQPDAAAVIMSAIETVLASGVHSPDLGGTASTKDVGHAVQQVIRDSAPSRSEPPPEGG